MKVLSVLVLSLVAAVSAQASRNSGAVHDVPVVYNDMLAVSKDVRERGMVINSIRIAKAPTQMRDLNPCQSVGVDSDIEVCEEPVKETMTDIVTVDFWYDDGCTGDCDSPRVDITLPLASFSVDNVARIRAANTKKFDLFGKQAKVRKALANELVQKTIADTTVTVNDYECTQWASGDSDLCLKQVKVGEHQAPIKTITFSAK